MKKVLGILLGVVLGVAFMVFAFDRGYQKGLDRAAECYEQGGVIILDACHFE